MQVMQTWRYCQGEFGLHHLPDPGGLNNQCAWLIDAFNILAGVEAELRKQESSEK